MALINLRNALLSGKRLPYDAEVEYLENTVVNHANYETIAFPYIDTGIPAADDVGVRITYEYRYLATVRGAMVCGSFVASGSGYFGVYNYGAYNYKMWGGATKMPTQIHVGEVLTTSLNFMESGIYEDNLNGATINSGSLSGSPTFNPSSIWAFAINKGNYSTYEIARLRIYGLEITKGSTLVRDYIPVRKGTVGYLYDRVTGKLFGNAGTGDFQYGPDVVPVEWLEGGQLNSGIAFIDTGYTPNSSTKIESTSAILSAWGYSGRFGNRSRLTFGVGNGILYLAQGNHYYLGGYTAGTFYSFVNDIPNRTVSVEGVGSTSTTAVSDWYPQLYPVYLFASNVSPTDGTNVNGKTLDPNSLGQIRMKSCSIWENNILVRSFRPVRVGSGSTWEGAMMDTLTRRIYRNAGTGAFGYGNDLKYPIPSE